MLLTYQIQGAFFVFQTHGKEYGMEEVIRFVGELANVTSDHFRVSGNPQENGAPGKAFPE